jgi:hypothetical protein
MAPPPYKTGFGSELQNRKTPFSGLAGELLLYPFWCWRYSVETSIEKTIARFYGNW